MRDQDIRTYFKNYLKRNNYRITPERFEVLDSILAINDHFDADDLFLRMKNEGSKVSRATVYNTLEVLTECSIVARDHFGEKLARYELVYGNEPHHHIVCQSCGKIEEFVDKRVDRLARDAARTMDYELDSGVLHIYGLCRECLERRNVPQRKEVHEAERN